MSPTKVLDGAEPVDVAVGARIRIQRRALDISQTRLAEGLGITFQQVQKYERGSNRVSASKLVAIAAILETTVAALVGEDGSGPSDPMMLVQLATPGALELLAAFAAIQDSDARRALIVLAERCGAEPSTNGKVRFKAPRVRA